MLRRKDDNGLTDADRAEIRHRARYRFEDAFRRVAAVVFDIEEPGGHERLQAHALWVVEVLVQAAPRVRVGAFSDTERPMAWVDLSAMPGTMRNTFRTIRRTARPIVAFARFPGPNRLTPAFMPISSTIGPLTMSSGADPPVLAVLP